MAPADGTVYLYDISADLSVTSQLERLTVHKSGMLSALPQITMNKKSIRSAQEYSDDLSHIQSPFFSSIRRKGGYRIRRHGRVAPNRSGSSPSA
jgi:hypothetical protein